MSNVDRNWLIRTSQNQILGPVAKAKVVEFIQKGALGLTDEVSSGNGYWFHLREKDLVEKYLFGDVPQSYNPISEAKTVLARKANPEKTTSINASPANITQVINLKDLNLKSSVPKTDDLEYPDITMVQKIDAPKNTESKKEEGIKLPNQDDLEFPDLDFISNSISSDATSTVMTSSSSSGSSSGKPAVAAPVVQENLEDLKLPNQDDLEYPDMDFMSTPADLGKPEVTQTVLGSMFTDKNSASHLIHEKSNAINAEEEEEVTFEIPPEVEANIGKPATKKEKTNTDVKLELINTKSNSAPEIETKSKEPRENAKMLHERKTRGSMTKKDGDNRVPTPPREIAPELKNRNDSYLFIVLIVLVLLIVGIVFYYYRFILNKPLPV